jgi:hypothetical protein
MQICFDIETAYQHEFRYGFATSYERAGSDVADLFPKIEAATAYIADTAEWKSFRQREIKALCALIARAERVITFNGKRWDIPVIGLSASAKTVISKLTKLSEPRTANGLQRAPRLHNQQQLIVLGNEPGVHGG